MGGGGREGCPSTRVQAIRHAARSIMEHNVALVQLATAGANLTPVAANIAVHRSVFEANLVFIP